MAAKSIRHRIPVSLRHYWKLVAGSIGLVAVLTLVVGTVRATALVYSDANEGFVVTNDIQGTVDLFDTDVAHEISLSYSDADFEEMKATFEESGEKEWIKADITIDGVTISDVGIRLKGNSTLSALGGGMTMGGDGEDGERQFPGGGEMPEGMGLPEGMEMPADGGQMPGGMGGGSGSSVSFDSPEGLPWLIDFAKYVDGQVYQGNQQISLRVESAMGGGSTLNEAVALELIEASGEASYDWNYSTVSVNGSEGVTRRVVDVMDATWAEEEYGANAGVLYKALSTGSFEYQGDDPDDYTDDFKQVTMEGSADVQPIVDFLKWLGEADDATFDAELGDWVDIASFANYTALQNLLANGDDMAGPGKNFYLWYDYETGLISIVTWDVDLTLQSADLAPDETASLGGGTGGGGFPGQAADEAATDGAATDETATAETQTQGQMPGGGEMPEGMAEGGMGGGMGGNELKERFLASEAFQDEYMAAYNELYDSLFASGTALEAVETAAAAAEANGADVADAAETLKATVQQRTEFLASELAAG
ncbi:CotH kinase family protein [Glycomyces sp. NPDC048151]|uniref:CotH kinase family protein n=1 Tax=Glycomyces sp. NPDC048151 TaxID=3364002 RepID=UPI0037244903